MLKQRHVGCSRRERRIAWRRTRGRRLSFGDLWFVSCAGLAHAAALPAALHIPPPVPPALPGSGGPRPRASGSSSGSWTRQTPNMWRRTTSPLTMRCVVDYRLLLVSARLTLIARVAGAMCAPLPSPSAAVPRAASAAGGARSRGRGGGALSIALFAGLKTRPPPDLQAIRAADKPERLQLALRKYLPALNVGVPAVTAMLRLHV